MPEPVLTTALGAYVAGYAALYGCGRRDTAVSQEIRSARIEAAKYFERSQALFGAKAAAISSLHEIADECSGENWDGYGAEPINLLALWNAEDLIRALPDGFPVPEVAPEPDGSISLDWTESVTRRLSASIGPSNRFAFAWLNGTERGHAVVAFEGVTLPDLFISVIESIVNYAKPSFRIA